MIKRLFVKLRMCASILSTRCKRVAIVRHVAEQDEMGSYYESIQLSAYNMQLEDIVVSLDEVSDSIDQILAEQDSEDYGDYLISTLNLN